MNYNIVRIQALRFFHYIQEVFEMVSFSLMVFHLKYDLLLFLWHFFQKHILNELDEYDRYCEFPDPHDSYDSLGNG